MIVQIDQLGIQDVEKIAQGGRKSEVLAGKDKPLGTSGRVLRLLLDYLSNFCAHNLSFLLLVRRGDLEDVHEGGLV